MSFDPEMLAQGRRHHALSIVSTRWKQSLKIQASEAGKLYEIKVFVV